MTHQESTMQTKRALAASLKKFMATKPLSKISVREIIEDCDVNRKTFYYHFQDIYDLLKWMLEQEAIEVVGQFDLLDDYEDAIRFVLQYVKENNHILCCTYDNMGREEMKRFFYNDFIALIQKVVEDCEERNSLQVPESFNSFLCDFLTEATAGMLVNAFKEKHHPSDESIIGNIRIIMDSLPDMLERAGRG